MKYLKATAWLEEMPTPDGTHPPLTLVEMEFIQDTLANIPSRTALRTQWCTLMTEILDAVAGKHHPGTEQLAYDSVRVIAMLDYTVQLAVERLMNEDPTLTHASATVFLTKDDYRYYNEELGDGSS